jgi:putative nucleotidyltransferase with HDIG domain
MYPTSALTREQAWKLMTEHTQNENLRKHMLAVEAAMRFYARKFGEDEELWGITGLLHDFDYEKHPSKEEHPYVGVKILEDLGYPEVIRRAILAHAEYTGVPAETRMEKTLQAVDELTGFIVAVALVRPNKNIAEVRVKSVKKKMKDKAFARAVNREDIQRGADLLGLTLEEHIDNVLSAMKGISAELDLAG